jgi:hypothetical protein
VASLALWSGVIVSVRRRGRSRWLLYPVLAMLFLFGVGGGLETVLAAVDEATLPKTGELVDVGGRRLHVECKGTGAPTVVFESGLGLSSAYWGRIAPTIARTTRVCVYDCAGRGGSDPVPAPQDGSAVADDLHGCLRRQVSERGSRDGPARRPADAFTALSDYRSTYGAIRIAAGLFPSLARLGVARLIYGALSSDLPSPYCEAKRAEQSLPRLQQGQRDEFAVLRSTLWQALRLRPSATSP